jgi:hypothetical protein
VDDRERDFGVNQTEKRQKVHRDSADADDAEPLRQHAEGEARDEQRREVERHPRAELALAVHAGAERVRHFADAQVEPGHRGDVEQRVEPFARQPRRDRIDDFAARSEET